MDRLEVNGIKKYDVTLPKEFCDYRVPRKFLHNIYGGGPQDAFPQPAQKFVDKYGMRKYLFLNLQDHQPAAPQNPGDPGLFYCIQSVIPDYSPRIVFTRVEMKLVCLWQLMGTYELYPSRPLSKEEWERQDSKVFIQSPSKYGLLNFSDRFVTPGQRVLLQSHGVKELALEL